MKRIMLAIAMVLTGALSLYIMRPFSAQVITPNVGVDNTSWTRGLVYRASFEEGSGSTVYDRIGTNTGTWHGNNYGGVGSPPTAAHYSYGMVGSWSGSFDGSTNYVSTGSPANSNYLNLVVTVSANSWPSTGFQTILSNQQSASPYAGYGIYANNTGGLLCTMDISGTSRSVTISSTFPTGSVHVVGCSYDGSALRGYLDGVQINTVAATGTIATSTVDLALGYSPSFTGRYFSGLLDEVLISNRAWSAQEMTNYARTVLPANNVPNVWTDTGTLTGFSGGSWNANAFHESGCTIVSSPCFKLYYGNFNTNDTYYAEAPDTSGVPVFTQYSSNPLITGCNYLKVFESGSTKYVYCSATFGAQQIDVHTCTSNTTCSMANAGAITHDGNSWDAGTVMQIGIAGQDGNGTWWGYYAGNNSGGNIWSVGQASSTDLIHWTRSSGNPIPSLSSGTYWNGSGNLHFEAVSGTVYGWSQTTFLRYGINQLPSDLMRWSASSVSSTTWTPTAFSTYWRTLTSECAGKNGGQVADPFMLQANGNVYLFNSANPCLNSSQQINLAIAYGQTLATLVQTNEGVIGSQLPWP